MSVDKLKSEQRLDELLIDQAIGGLDSGQQAELRSLLADDADEHRNPYMETAALVQLGMASLERSSGRGTGGMPADLKSRLMAQAGAHAQTARPEAVRRDNVIEMSHDNAIRREPETPTASASGGILRHAGWAVAAAFAFALVIVSGDPKPASDAPLSRGELLADAATVTIPWAGAENGYEQVSGDVVWNDELQQGYMRLAGLSANDPSQAQYQLWIVDPERSAQPVDGGVFDMPAGDGEVIIPVTAKLGVDKPAAFAITLEKPGGVVVSAGPLLVVAADS